MNLNVTITKTSRGDQDYIQIMSDDMVSVNVVLVADRIEVQDHRGRGPVLAGEEPPHAERRPRKRR